MIQVALIYKTYRSPQPLQLEEGINPEKHENSKIADAAGSDDHRPSDDHRISLLGR